MGYASLISAGTCSGLADCHWERFESEEKPLDPVGGNGLVGAVEDLEHTMHPHQLEEGAGRLPQAGQLYVSACGVGLAKAPYEGAQTAAVDELDLGEIKNEFCVLGK
jgi:hypothetical protein